MISREELERAFDARFPPEVKEKLRRARVAVAGLGGLGSNIAVMLARSGVGHLFLVDFDRVDVTNLNRQMYLIPHLGMTKCWAMEQIIGQISPYLDIRTRVIRVTEENAAGLFAEYPIVCEAFDQADQKAMLVGTLLRSCPQTTLVSGSGDLEKLMMQAMYVPTTVFVDSQGNMVRQELIGSPENVAETYGTAINEALTNMGKEPLS